MGLLAGRVAIVTGAGAGLGRSHALFLASQGACIVVNDQGSTASSTAEEIKRRGGVAVASIGSVTDENTTKAMVDDALDQWGRVDILVNNAGILRDRTFANMTMDEFRLVIDVHVIGAAICTKAVWDQMRAQKFGRIVMTTSSSGLFGNFGQSNYGAAKMALVGLMQTLSLEGEKHNIRVNCLAPTAATAMLEGILPDDVLQKFDPALVSPGLLPLVTEDAPTRSILCAGGGHFAASNITLTRGINLVSEPDLAQAVVNHWSDIVKQDEERVPPYGRMQLEQALAGAAGAGGKL